MQEFINYCEIWLATYYTKIRPIKKFYLQELLNMMLLLSPYKVWKLCILLALLSSLNVTLKIFT